jgi:succinate dehydrogenase / fumarate reductase cytochrome b subunit
MINASAIRSLPFGLLGLWQTSVGKKAVMAVTGIILYGYVVLHMWGNWKIFLGADPLNEYAHWLRSFGSPLFPHEGVLWIVRAILLASVTLHILAAYQVTRMDWAARPRGYKTYRTVQASYASLTMRWGGIIIALFIVYHILQLTTGTVLPGFSQDVYRNVVRAFSVWWIDSIYIAAMAALGAHLYHGIWSAAQTLGLNNTRWNGFWRGLAVLSGLALFIGNSAMPLAVLAGVVR